METQTQAKTEEYEVGVVGFAQCGSDDYYIKHRLEEIWMRKRIKEKFGETPEGSILRWKGSNHEFGTYYTMYYYCNPQDPEHMAFQEKLEDHDWEKYQESLEGRWRMVQNESFEEQRKMFSK